MVSRAAVSEVRMALTRPEFLDSSGAHCRERGMEHRLGTRMPVSIPVRLDERRETLAFGRVVNVSLSGAYVETPTTVHPLLRVDVVCGRMLPDRSGSFRVAAYVTRATTQGLAVEWLEFAPAAIRTLIARAESQTRGRVASARETGKSPATMPGPRATAPAHVPLS